MQANPIDPARQIARYSAELARVSGRVSLKAEASRRLRAEIDAIEDAIDSEEASVEDLKHLELIRFTLNMIDGQLAELRASENWAIRGLESYGFDMAYFKR